MKENGAIWYVADENGQPEGPYTASTILARVFSGDCNRAALCWREGMPDWQPLNEVEPFHDEFAQLNAQAWRRVIWIVLIALILCGVGVGGYSFLTRGGWDLLSSNSKQEEEVLRQLQADCHEIFYGNARPLTDLDEILADDYMWVNMDDGSIQDGKDAYMRLLEQSRSQLQRSYRSYKATSMVQSIQLLSNVAVVDNKPLFEAVTIDGKVISLELLHTNIWRKTKGRWRLVHTTWYGESSQSR
jgi:ketosteroid isomerase-like protein